jgi:hypothetical protein
MNRFRPFLAGGVLHPPADLVRTLRPVPPSGLAVPARFLRRVVVSVVAVLVAVLPSPLAVDAAVVLQSISVAPTCVAPGVATRVVILGASWAPGPVTLEQNTGRLTTPLGTATARTSPVRQRPGSFSFTVTVTAAAAFRVIGRQGNLAAAADVAVQSTCPLQISAKPPCLAAAGPVQVSGSGFVPGSSIPIDVDPFGNAETPSSQEVSVARDGTFSTTVEVPFSGATVPIIATRPSTSATAVIPAARAVAFVDPCPPPPTTTTTTKPPVRVTTTAPKVAQRTTTTKPNDTPPPSVPPDIPPIDVPTPGATAEVSFSPRTVRPGRCVVLVVAAAPPALPVVARYADGPPVTSQTGPAGGAVLSLCHPHDSGMPLGPVKILVGIGPAAPVPLFTVLRVPTRPQPPLLQAGADGRRL